MPKVKLLPVEEDCWKVIMEFCTHHQSTPMKAIRALISKSELGEFTRFILNRRYKELKNKKAG